MPPAKPRRRERRPQDRAAAEAARTERLEAMHQQLEQGVAAIYDGDAWKSWLGTAAKFHRYSFNNQILLFVQNPNATLVAGFGAWKAMGRRVRKGEKALWVLAPVTARASDGDAEQEESSTRNDRAGTGGQDAAERRPARRVVGFRPAAVFDVAQTDGDPLPEPPRPQLLEGQAPEGLWDALGEAIAARGFQVGRCPDAAAIGGANGVTNFADRTVTVRADVSDAQAVKTLAHEAAHVVLHDPRSQGEDRPDCRGVIEVEAESVAYLVATHHGMDTAGYSFAYVAQWAGRDEQAVTATAGRVLSAARGLIEATTPDEGQPAGQAADLAEQAHTAAAAAQSAAQHAEATRELATAAAGAAAAQVGEDRLRAVVDAAQAWFLEQAAGSGVYAEAAAVRGHSTQDALALGAGYAPPGWTGLVDHLRSAGFSDREQVDAGVAGTTRTGRLIDRFRGRVTFPIHDGRGPVGFTARDTSGGPDAPKYLNTAATGLFAKSTLLFGTQHLDQRAGTVVLVEGPWDALAVTAATGGTAVGVAACGTAVTDHHLDLVHRTGRPLVLAPDPDPAGTAAMGRALAMLAERGQPHPAAAETPAGTDLADLYAAGGAQAVRSTLAQARPAGIAYAQAYLAAHPPSDAAEARVAAARDAAVCAAELTAPQRDELAAVLVEHGGIGEATAEAVIDTIGPRTVVLPKAAGSATAAPSAADQHRRQPTAKTAL